MWRIVSQFSGATRPENRFVDRLDEVLREADIDATRLGEIDGHRALVTGLAALRAAVPDALGGEVPSAQAGAADTAIFVPAIRDQGPLDGLSALTRRGAAGLSPPTWVGVSPSLVDADLLDRQLASFGAGKPAVTLTLPAESGSSVEFELSRIPPDPAVVADLLAAGADKNVPEGPDNLRQRADWFRRRSGETR